MSDNYNYVKLCPFKWYVLENFPFIEADFDALTNWQLFCKLGKELNKVINSTNSIGTQVESLTDYVNNYFDNLDVQDEIDNKLDAMAESGELAEIIASYINLNSVLTIDTVADMVANENLVAGSYVKTLGFYEIGDGGGAEYQIVNNNLLNVDDAFVIGLNSGLKAILQYNDEVSILQIGGKRQTDSTKTNIHDIVIKYIEKNEASDTPFTLLLPSGIYYTSPIEIVSNNYSIKGETERTGVINGTSAKPTILSAIDNQAYIIKCGDESEGSGYGSIENIVFSSCHFNSDYSRDTYKEISNACLIFNYVYFMRSKWLSFEYIKGTAFKISTSWELMIDFLDFYHIDAHENGIFVFDSVINSVANGNISDSNFEYLRFEQILGDGIVFKNNNKSVSLHFGTINVEPSAITDMNYVNGDYVSDMTYEKVWSLIELQGDSHYIIDNIQLNNMYHKYHVINSLNYIFGDVIHLNKENLIYKIILNNISLHYSNTNVNLIKSLGTSYDNWYSKIIINNISNNSGSNMLLDVKDAAKIDLKDCLSGMTGTNYYIREYGQMIPCYKNIYNSYLSVRGLINYDIASVNPEHLVIKNNSNLTSTGKRLFGFMYNSTTLKVRAKIDDNETIDVRVFAYNPATNSFISISDAETLTGTGEYEQYTITLNNVTKMYGTIAYFQIVNDNEAVNISVDTFSN